MKLRYDDKKHGYWLDGKRCKSVTTVAKIPDDLYRLQLWQQRQVAIGLASSPGLIEAVAAHVEDREILDGLCEKAKEAAGANRKSMRGTAAHRVTESYDQGKDIITTELSTSILASWAEILTLSGLEVIPEWMERVVIYPDQRICGKFDRICRDASGDLVMADLKSGERAIQYPHSIAIQLAMYANAPLLAGPLNERGETEVFEELPPLRKDYGIVIHIPEIGKAQAVKIDIAAGWAAVKDICFPTIQWRAKKPAELVQAL